MAQNQATFSIADYDREGSSMSVNVGPITVVNFTALHDAIDDLEAAIPGMILGEIRQTTIAEKFPQSTAVVTDKDAQRERKWLITYRDVTEFLDVGNTINNTGYGNLYTKELPTADASLLPNTATDELDLSAGAVATFVTAFEAVENSPTGGPDIEVVSIKLVGRNL